MNASGGNVTRITNSGYHHHIFGISPNKRYIVASRTTEDMNGDGKINDSDASQKSVQLLDLQTKIELQLSPTGTVAEGRTFSPDGEWVAFWMLAEGESQSDIYIIGINGTGLTNLSNTLGVEQNEYDPAWSNDGTRIAYNKYNTSTGRMTLNVMNSDGSNQQVIFDSTEGADTPLFPKGAYDPSWSPDDEWITFDKATQFTGDGENLTAGVWHIYKIASDGSGSAIDMSEAGSHDNRAEYLPSFSPDGSQIVYSSRYYDSADLENAHIDIFVMDATTGEVESRLTDTGLTAYDMFSKWIQ